MNGQGRFPELLLRPVEADDAPRVRRLFERLSPDTVYRRFFTLFPTPPPAILSYLAHPETVDHEGLAALDGDEIVALGSWDRIAGTTEAELAVLVEDAWQHRGLGRELTRALVAEAAHRGITILTATMLSENDRARRLATRLARPEHVHMDGPATHFTFRVAS